MSDFRVFIDPAIQGGQQIVFTVHTPIDAQFADELGTKRPSAQQLADFYAGEYCDSGTVLVEARGDRGLVARRQVSA